ncbi:MAG: methionine--tRNA ligase [Gemmatimonadota bacterium]|nr:methionine--tRNA ligase [Gemmatimonadota bacterium]
MDSFYLTTPIYYASGPPHLGHAYTTILGDVLARYHRRRSEDVLFLTGTDEHGQKIQTAAAEAETDPQSWCDDISDRFKAAWRDLSVSYDRFIRTTEDEHKAVVLAFLEALFDNGHVYEAEYVGWYSVGQERYFTEKEIGPDRVDPVAGKPVERIQETNWFFRMSDFQERLVRHIEENPDWIIPESRKNEVLGFLSQPLGDLSISRPRSRVSWGIPLPWDPDHVAYVWVDALTNYVTASGQITPDLPPDERGFGASRPGSRWPADLHLIGKDILTTHAVYWPTLLMGAGLPLPRKILSHGWWVVGETKMSKSLGNVVDPLFLRGDYGTDAVRWYLIREMSTGQDASYTPERFVARYGELANILGNLAHRTLSMIVRYRSGVMPAVEGRGLEGQVEATVSAYHGSMASYRLHDAMAAAMELAREANGYVEEREPWALAKDPDKGPELDETLATLGRVLAVLTCLFEPVMPGKARELASRLGLEEPPRFEDLETLSLAGRSMAHGEPLFPRVEIGDVTEA